MAREYQNMRDQNIVNAWNEGGKFEGQKVTDDMLIDFLKDRRAGVSPDDPLYDQYDQRVTEYTWAVKNSKQELAYAEGKVGDAAMSRFYKQAAGALPKDSEAWRNMMKLAAQYADRAASAGRGGGGGGRGGGRGGGYNSAQNRLPSAKELTYDTFIGELTRIARQTGILNDEDETLSDLRAFEKDGTRLMELIDLWNSPANAERRDQITKYIKQYGDPNFNGDYSFNALSGMFADKTNGVTGRLNKAQKAGMKGDTTAITKEMGEGSDMFLSIVAAPPLAAYEEARRIFGDVAADPNVTPIDLLLAKDDLVGRLQKVSDDLSQIGPTQAVVDAFGTDAFKPIDTALGHVNNEIESLLGRGDINAPTWMEDSRGEVAAAHPEGGGETARNVAAFAELEAQVRELTDGSAVMVRKDDKGNITNDGTGKFSTARIADLPEGSAFVPSAGGMPASITLSDGTSVRTAGVMSGSIGTPINAIASSNEVDFAGRPLGFRDPKSVATVGVAHKMPDGSTVYQYWGNDGIKRYSNVNPFRGELNPVSGTFEVDVGAFIEGKDKKKFDPYLATAPEFADPKTASLMPNAVGLSSYAAWVSGPGKDTGVAFSESAESVRLAVDAELGPGATYNQRAAVWADAEQARNDFMVGTPDFAKRLRAANRAGEIPTLADAAGIKDNAFVGMANELDAYFQRQEHRGPQSVSDPQYLRDRDAIIADALKGEITPLTIRAFQQAGIKRNTVTFTDTKFDDVALGLRRAGRVVGRPMDGTPMDPKAETVSAFNSTAKGLIDANLKYGQPGILGGKGGAIVPKPKKTGTGPSTFVPPAKSTSPKPTYGPPAPKAPAPKTPPKTDPREYDPYRPPPPPPPIVKHEEGEGGLRGGR